MKRALPLSSLLLAALCACGGASRPAAGPAHREAAPAEEEALAEIAELAAELRDMKRDIYRSDRVCTIVRPEQWLAEEEQHPLADVVCTNRDETCRLADQVGDNAWADSKCDDARRACRSLQSACTRVTTRPQIF